MRESDRLLLGILTVMILACAGKVLAAGNAAQSLSRTTLGADWAAQCKLLEDADLSGVIDAPTQVTAAKAVEPKQDLGGYCQVTGYVTPNVAIKAGLPRQWNGKFMELGCGGHCGVLPRDDEFQLRCGEALRQGFACVESDMGHTGTMTDGLWGYNNLQAKLDWGFRATHVAALAGKAITERYYRESPRKSYFMGCSTGGRQALQEAQRFPWDFDGIVAGAPPISLPQLYIMFAWGYRVTHAPNGHAILGLPELKLLHDAAVAQCDEDDGLTDGIVGSPLTCQFHPAVLSCKSGQTASCLNASQVQAAERIYEGPSTSQGQPLLSGGPLPGSEYDGLLADPAAGNWNAAYVGTDDKLSGYTTIAQEGFRYLLFDQDPGPTWKITDFSFDRDYKRLGVMGALYDSSNPDLRKFAAAGGKLLIYSGMNDNSVLPRMVTDYYEKVVAVTGGAQKTAEFARLFQLPGVGHCVGGPGADSVDYLAAIENWVERGQPPSRLIAYHLKKPLADLKFPPSSTAISFSRPVFPYPTRYHYNGSGDPNDARNFAPLDPAASHTDSN